MGLAQSKAQARAGFSILEAIIALAITGFAMTVVLSIGTRGSQMGFGLGNRILSTTDDQMRDLTLQSVVSSMIVPSSLLLYRPPTDFRATAFTKPDGDNPLPLEGDAQHLVGSGLLKRDTACGDQGPVGRLELGLETMEGKTLLVCRVDAKPPKTLMNMGVSRASFAYSRDGVTWTDRVSITPGAPPNALSERGKGRVLFVRIATEDGKTLIVAKADSGRPRVPSISDADL